MANNTMRQAKLRKLLLDGETTTGTYEVADSASLVVPVMGDITPTLDRGTGMISRASTQDGYAGSLASVRGSTGWSLTTEMEIHNVASKYNYWTLALLACGFRGVNVADFPNTGDSTFRLTPSTRVFDDYSAVAADSDPITVSLTVTQNNNEVDDWAQRLRGATGVATFDLTAGEIAKLSIAWKGQVVDQADPANDFLDLSDPNVSAFGTVTAWATPFVVNDMVIEIDDANGDPRNACIQSLSINMNSNHADYPCPSEKYGFESSPVFQDDAPTFDLVFPSNAVSDPWIFAQLRSGATFSIDAQLQAADGRTCRIVIPKGQFESASWTNVNGAVAYQLSCRAVRDPGAGATPPITIEYVYTVA